MARFMRVIVFFDLPTITNTDKREYRKFRQLLIKSGFLMIQESVYSKLVLNTTAANVVLGQLRKGKPRKGLVQAMIVTEKQYARIEFIVGDQVTDVLNDNSETVII